MFRLRNKVFLLTYGLFLAAVAFTGVFGIVYMKTRLEQEFNLRGLVLIRTFLNVSIENLERGQREPVQDFLDSLLADPDVEEAYLLDVQGNPVAFKHREEGSGGSFKPDPERFSAALKTFTPQFYPDKDHMAVYHRVWGDAPSGVVDLGVCYLKLSLYRFNRQTRNVALVYLGFLAAFSVVIVALSYLFSAQITRPLEQLRAAAGEIARGNFNVRLNTGSGDEIGKLSRDFSEMALQIEQRTRELQKAMEELKQTQDRVIRSEKLAAIGQLASGVGHELRNPLAAIQNAIFYVKDALKDTPAAQGDPSLNEFLVLAEREVNAAENIVKDLLDFSRVVRLNLRPWDIHACLGELDSVVKVPENVKVVKRFAAGLPQANIDFDKMRQVFINLANNAIQAMEKGGELTVATELKGQDSSRWIEVSFKDTGVGLTEEARKKIFEPLFTTKASGTGLGLAICQGIVDKHGGSIGVESEPGRGTTFTIRIPLTA